MFVGYIHPEPMTVTPNNKSLLLYIVQRLRFVHTIIGIYNLS